MAIHFSKDNTRRSKEEFLDSEVFQLYSAGLCCVCSWQSTGTKTLILFENLFFQKRKRGKIISFILYWIFHCCFPVGTETIFTNTLITLLFCIFIRICYPYSYKVIILYPASYDL